MPTKICKTCGIEKDNSEFSKGNSKNKYGTRAHCKQCRATVWLESYRKLNPQYRIKSEIIPQTDRDRWMRAVRGITEAKYNEQLVKQNGVCAICKKAETVTRLGKLKELAIDHDHKTGKFRALLCQKCNVGLGHFFDSPELLITAAQYLKSHE